jgi:hypothetical protein
MRKTNIAELNSTEVAVGHCVIANSFDRPSCELVAVVKSISNSIVEMEYLCHTIAKSPCGAIGTFDSVTPIDFFGIRVKSNGSVYWCERFDDSFARYEDGKKRDWQDERNLGVEFPVNRKCSALIEK